MPRYFFDFREGEHEPFHDGEGLELPTSEAAKSEAVKTLLAHGPRYLEQGAPSVSVFARDGNHFLFEAVLSLQTRDMEEFGEL